MIRIGTALLGIALFAIVQTGTTAADAGGVPNVHACRGVVTSAFAQWRKAVLDGAVVVTGTTKTQGDFNLTVRTGCGLGLSPEVVSVIILNGAGEEAMAAQFLEGQFGLSPQDAAAFIGTADGIIAGGGLPQ